MPKNGDELPRNGPGPTPSAHSSKLQATYGRKLKLTDCLHAVSKISGHLAVDRLLERMLRDFTVLGDDGLDMFRATSAQDLVKYALIGPQFLLSGRVQLLTIVIIIKIIIIIIIIMTIISTAP